MERIYQDYVSLIKSIASKYRGILPFEDLIQEGFLGLLEAKGKFDSSKNVKFSTYAFYWIKKRISEAVKQERNERVRMVELNEEILSDPYTGPEDGWPDEVDIDKRILESLSQVERSVLYLHFYEGKDLSEVAKTLGLPRERVRQIKSLVLRKMKINRELTKDLFGVHRWSI